MFDLVRGLFQPVLPGTVLDKEHAKSDSIKLHVLKLFMYQAYIKSIEIHICQSLFSSTGYHRLRKFIYGRIKGVSRFLRANIYLLDLKQHLDRF